MVRGFPVSMNFAVFKPRKQLLVNKLLGCPNAGYYKCVMDMGDDKVIAEFVNGAVYFKPFHGSNLKKCDYSELVICRNPAKATSFLSRRTFLNLKFAIVFSITCIVHLLQLFVLKYLVIPI